MEERHDDGPDGFAFDRRSMLRKLAVGGTLAWSAPMIASRASALMPPSVCMNDVEVDWTTLYPAETTNLTNPVTITDVQGSGVDVTIGSTIAGTTAMARNFQVQGGAGAEHGAIPGNSLMFEQRPFPNTDAPGGGANDGLGGQTITISFSTTVRNISFTLTDIDNDGGAWSDRITLITTPSSTGLGSAIIGIGATGNGTGGTTTDGNGGDNTSTGAFRNSVNDNNLDDDEDDGNLTLTYAGPIDTLSFRYWCGADGAGNDSNQRINMSNITFDTCPEGVEPGLAPQSAPVEAELRVPALDDDPPAPPLPGFD